MQQWAIGVDLGGTKIEVAIVSSQGELLDKLRIPTISSQGPDKIIENIHDTINDLSKRHSDITLSVVGIGVAGQIKKDTGIVIDAPNLKWHNVDLQTQLANKLQKPVAVCNDVKAAAWGELLCGAGVGCNNLVCIFVGTGIGGAIVCNGKMLDGCNNTAGEIGHMIVQLHGPLCHCGNKGCLEALASGWALERDARLTVQNDKAGGKMLLDIAEGNINAITGETVTMAAQQGDPLANSLINNMADALIAGVTSVVNMIGPCRVILGGGIIKGIPQLITQVEEGVKRQALKAAIVAIEILPAKLQDDSGVIGAAAYAFETLKKVPYDH